MSDLELGFVLGFLAAGFLGYAAQQLRASREAMGAADKPMKATVETKNTPAEVVSRSHQGCIAYYFWVFLLGSLVLIALAWALGFLPVLDRIFVLFG